MNRVYEILKLNRRNVLTLDKNRVEPLAPEQSANTLSLLDEMASFEKLVVGRVGKLKAAVTTTEAMGLEKSQKAQELAGSLQAEVAALKTMLKETQESATRVEEILNARIKDLQNELAKRDETLGTRDNQINQYKSTIDDKVKQLTALELAIKDAEAKAASNAERADDLAANYQGKIATIESQLTETQSIVRQKEWTINNLEQRLGNQVQELESTIKNQQELLTGRDSEINDLKSQLKRLTKGLSEVSSFFRNAKVLKEFEGEDLNTADQDEGTVELEEKPAAALSDNAIVVPPAAAQETVPSEIFRRITAELARVANIIAPLASLMVRQQAQALGETLDKFPTNLLPQLLEGLANEVSRGNPKIDCREQLAQSAQITLH